MLEALGYGALAACSLLIGAWVGLTGELDRRAVGLVLGFGAGALISSVSFELAEDGVRIGGGASVGIGLAVGALTYYVCDGLVERSSGGGDTGNALALGAFLDGIPEQLVLGIGIATGEGVSVGLLGAIFVSNLPEAIGASNGMRAAGRRRPTILRLWLAVTIVLTLATVARLRDRGQRVGRAARRRERLRGGGAARDAGRLDDPRGGPPGRAPRRPRHGARLRRGGRDVGHRLTPMDPSARRRFLAPLALAQFICSFAGSNMNVMINDISEDLDTTVTGVQVTITLFLLIMAVLMIPCSKLTDRWGRKRCFTAGLILYGVGALLSAVSPGLGILILGNSVFEGVGTALLIPPVYILTTLAFKDVTSRARAFGVISGLGGIGAAAGPLIGGVITSAISWRAAFVFQALVIALIVLLSRRVTDPIPADPERPFDTAGAVLSAVGMFCVVFGILQADNDALLMAAFLVVGTALLVWFFLYIRARERQGREPLLSTALFRNRTSNIALVTQNLQWLVLMGTSFVVAVFLQTVRGYDAIETGVIFTAATLGVLVSSLAAERFAKRRAQRTLIAAGFVMVVVGVGLLLALVGASSRAVAFGPGLLADRAGCGSDAHPVGQRRPVQLPRGAAGRDLGPVAQRVEPRLIASARRSPGRSWSPTSAPATPRTWSRWR